MQWYLLDEMMPLRADWTYAGTEILREMPNFGQKERRERGRDVVGDARRTPPPPPAKPACFNPFNPTCPQPTIRTDVRGNFGGLQTPCVTFRWVVASLRGPEQSPVLPFACCVGLLLSVGRCGRCSC